MIWMIKYYQTWSPGTWAPQKKKNWWPDKSHSTSPPSTQAISGVLRSQIKVHRSPNPSKAMATFTHMPWAKRNFWKPLVVLTVLETFEILLTPTLPPKTQMTWKSRATELLWAEIALPRWKPGEVWCLHLSLPDVTSVLPWDMWRTPETST